MPVTNKHDKLLNEYRDFKNDANLRFHDIPHQFILFGSLKTNKRSPRDIDVHVDVGQLSKGQTAKFNHNIKSLTAKYKHIDLMVWLFKGKRLPTPEQRKKLRWKDTKWKTLNQSSKYRIMRSVK